MSEEMTSTLGQREDLVHQDNDQGLQGQGQGSNHKEAGVNPLSGGKLKFNEKKLTSIFFWRNYQLAFNMQCKLNEWQLDKNL